jgi:1-acyl-sn-glycerol-3-phosphate acyltransferase
MDTGLVQQMNLDRHAAESGAGPLPRRDVSMLVERVFPALRSLVRAGYFSLDVEGAHHVPRTGPAIYVANHAGWFTLDTLLGALVLADHVGTERLPWGAVQDQLLKTPRLGRFFEKMGGFPASWMRAPFAIPKEMQIFSIYPEGIEGNCKSFLHAYQMRAWRSGFVRLAIARGAPIVPVAIIGGEECLPVVSSIRFVKPLLGTILPLPLSILPLPTRWKFIFHEPVRLTERDLGVETDVDSRKRRFQALAGQVRARVQRTIDRETSDHMLVRFSKLVRGPLNAAKPTRALPARAYDWSKGSDDRAAARAPS